VNICSVIVTTVGGGRSGVRISAEVRGFSVLQKSSPTLGSTQPTNRRVSVLFSGGKAGTGGGGLNLTTHLHLASRLRVSGALRLFPIYTFMAWRGKMLPCLQGHGSSRETQTGISMNWFVKELAKGRRLS